MNSQRKANYRTGLLDPRNLSTSQQIENALDEFSAVLNKDTYAKVLEDLFEHDHIVELVFSGIGDHVALKDWMLSDFPKDAGTFEASFCCRVIRRLSKFLQFHSSAIEVAALNVVELAPKVLQVLSRMSFAEVQQVAKAATKKMKAKISQREAKQAKRAAQGIPDVDYDRFLALSLPLPKSKGDADSLCADIFAKLEAVLLVLLTEMKRSDIFEIVKAFFIQSGAPQVECSINTNVPRVLAPESALAAPTTESAPSTYPIVQPLKAALYFDESPEDFGSWPICLATSAVSDIRKYRQDGSVMFQKVLDTVKSLSQGYFTRDKHKCLLGHDTAVPVYEAKLGGDPRLVYTIDCISRHDGSPGETQAIRIFGVFRHNQFDDRLWKSVSLYLSKRNDQYRKRCLLRQPAPEGGRYDPATFGGDISSEELTQPGQSDSQVPTLPGDQLNELHQIISLEKYVMVSTSLLRSIKLSIPASFPFKLSSYEETIVQHPYSCYVLGRSGTGKTTTMLYKMLLQERLFQMSFSHESRPLQMFVTKSRVLAKKVEEQFMAYFMTLLSASHSEHLYPSVAGLDQRILADDPENLFSLEEDGASDSHLPECFSQLETRHFPLFITFEKLCNMLEADIQARPLKKPGARIRQQGKGELVTYRRFLSHYWPRLQSSLHPSLVYSEFMGVIAGSEPAILSEEGFISRNTYREYSCRAQATFVSIRDVVYDLYESYRKIKREHGDIDPADRTRAIIRSFTDNASLLHKVTHLYVDETQDLLLIDTLLLRMLCSNPQGLFWAGDTAQTISAGSTFRFNELKAFLYRIEEKRRRPKHYAIPARVQQPKIFELTVNYRSHAGIVNCADAIVQLITKYWRSSIDVLQPERGKTNGAKPIFYENVYAEYVQEGRFMKKGATQYAESRLIVEIATEMGQLLDSEPISVLVRDDDAKQRLLKKLRFDIGIVLTVAESKGLEFNDVFLYNFFEDSTVPMSHWRLVLNDAVPNGVIQQLGSTPGFDHIKHAALRSELQCLYVAITRARNNLRIADESKTGTPMKVLWASRDYIVTCNPGEETKDFAVPSQNKWDWVERAKYFFENEQYLLAEQSYKRAGRVQSARVAFAYHLRKLAFETPVEGGRTRRNAFTTAAEAFAACASAVLEQAARRRYLQHSGECYEKGHLYLQAAQKYEQGGFLDNAIICFKRAGNFDNVHDILKNSSKKLTPTVREEIRDVASLHFVAKQNYEKVHQLFDNIDEENAFLEDRNLDLAQVDLLMRHGNKLDAAELHLTENRTFEAIDLFLEEGSDTALRRATDCVLQGLWSVMPFGITQSGEEAAAAFFERSDLVRQRQIGQDSHDEISMFRAIHAQSTSDLVHLADKFLYRDNVMAAFLCLDHVYVDLPQLSSLALCETEKELRRFSTYVRILREFSIMDNPISDPRVPLLFGLRLLDDDHGSIAIPPRSPIALYIESEDLAAARRDAFVNAFRKCLQARLLDRVAQQNDAVRRASTIPRSPWQLPCIRHVVYADCSDFCQQIHTAPNTKWRRLFVNVHLLQITIYQSLAGLQYPSEMKSQQRFWILKLYEALNPASHHFGSTYGITRQSFRDIPAAAAVVLDWVRAVSFNLSFEPKYEFLSIAMQCATFLYILDKEAAAFIAKCHYMLHCPWQYVRMPIRQNTLQEMSLVLDTDSKFSIPAGIHFLRHVVNPDARLSVNMPVLCSFIEQICTRLIVCNRIQCNGDLHSVILPRTWFCSILPCLNMLEARHHDCSHFWPILQPLHYLLRALLIPTEYAQFLKVEPGFKSLDRRTNQVRGVYIARICRVLGLLCANIRVGNFQEDIVDIFRTVKKEHGRGFSPLYGSYFYAEVPYQVIVATRRSMRESPFDNMVQALHVNRLPSPITEILGLSRIVFSNSEDLLRKIQACDDTESSPLTLSDSVEVPYTPLNVQADQDRDEDEQHTDADADPDIPKPPDENFIPETVIDQSLYSAHSELDNKSAEMIQKTYQAFKNMKRSAEGVTHAARTRRWFLRFRDFVRRRPPHRDLDIVYLGCMPHLLAVAEVVLSSITRVKKQLNRSLVAGNTSPDDLDRISSKQNLVATTTKGLKHHHSRLSPGPEAHLPRTLKSLIEEVTTVVQLIQGIQPLLQLATEDEEGLLLVTKGILQVARQPSTSAPSKTTSSRELRPSLVMEDVMDLIEERWEE